jgi:hypothetical protein
MRKVILIFVAVGLFLAGLITARAQNQSTARITLYSLQTTDFPAMTAGLDVFDSAGNLVTGLEPEAVTLLEDNQPRQLNILEELPAGVQFALALDPGPAFSFQDANAVSRYDKIEKVLLDWAATHSDSLGDDLSLVPTEGTLSTHLATSAAFSDALTAYSPALQFILPSLNTLGSALDVVSESAPQAGTKRVILFVTSPLEADAVPTLQNLTQRAVDQQVRVHVWIVASPDSFSTSGATALEDLATQTGGQYFLFSGEEPLTGLETYLAPLRHTYRLTYTSGILTPGGHTLTAQVNLNGEAVTSGVVSFELDVQPPNPILVAPPEQIARQAPDEKTTDPTAFLPTQQQLDIIVEFPDGRTLSLVRTTLYVDNQKAAENTAAPFDHFTWDLSGYTTSGQHTLQVEVVDDLGLSKISLGVPVTVTIIRTQRGWLSFLSRNSRWVALGAILTAGMVLGAILAWGRIRRRSRPAGRRSRTDPLTQPVHSGTAMHALRLPRMRPAKQSEAYLVRLKEDGEPVAAAPIPVIAPEMTFGSDPIQATRILDDPSVSPLHARLKQENGEYILFDEKSAAGTWVNYEPLMAPRRLQHGDILHIGRLAYRFMLQKPPERPTPRITPFKK